MNTPERVLIIGEASVDEVRQYEEAGHVVEVVASLDEAKHRLRKRGPARIVMDADLLEDQVLADACRVEAVQTEEALRESEEKYRALFDNLNEAMAVDELLYDDKGNPVDWRVLDVNPAYLKATKQSREEMVGRRLTEIYRINQAPEPFLSQYAHVVQTGESVQFEGYFEGLQMHLLISAFPLGGARFATLTTDITDRKRTEEALEAERAQLQAVLDSLPVAVWIADEEATVVRTNKAVEKIWGKPKPRYGIEEYAEYKGWWADTGEMIKPEDWALARAVLKGEVSTGEVINIERFNGTRGTILNNAAPVRDSEGRIFGGVAVAQDITELKQAEEELQSSRELLQAIIDNIPVLLVIWDERLQEFRFNKHLRQALGWTEADASEGNFLHKVYPDPEYRREVEDYMHSLQPGWRDLKTTAKDGSQIDISWANIHLSGGTSIGIGIDIRDRKQSEQRREDLLKREQYITEMLQGVLIPDVEYKNPKADVAVRYEPAYEEANVGGDFYDVFDMGGGRIGILIGDVAGKGLKAATRVAAIRYSIRGYAYLDPRPSRVLTLANDALCRDDVEDAPMATAFFAVVDTRTGSITYANAGHEPAMLRTQSGECEKLEIHGLALGIIPGFDYPEDARALRLGDILVAVTDGITEARPESGELFGTEGTKVCLSGMRQTAADEIADCVLSTAKDHAGGSLRDDAAIVVFGLRDERKGR